MAKFDVRRINCMMMNPCLYEYLSIIPLSPSVASEAMDMKIEFKVKYGWDTAVKSMPHITLCNIIQPDFIEEKLINNYDRLAANMSSFEICFSGFRYFRGLNHTIYLSIQNEQPFIEIVKHIKECSKSILKTVKNYRPYYARKPHLTIAKGIPQSDFIRIWPGWENKEYNAVSTAEKILLLRRPMSAIPQKYVVIGDFLFRGNSTINGQLKLF